MDLGIFQGSQFNSNLKLNSFVQYKLFYWNLHVKYFCNFLLVNECSFY